MLISLCLFWPPILCSQQLKLNGNDLFVHLFFSCWWAAFRNILFIVHRSCVCWASGCCWDKLSQRDRKNKKKTVLVFQTFMWRIRRRRVNTGILFYWNHSRRTVNSSPGDLKVRSWRGSKAPQLNGIIYFQYNYSIKNTVTVWDYFVHGFHTSQQVSAWERWLFFINICGWNWFHFRVTRTIIIISASICQLASFSQTRNVLIKLQTGYAELQETWNHSITAAISTI